ncbi:MAG: DUF1553 domain-containing protein [Rubripirellula sp.]
MKLHWLWRSLSCLSILIGINSSLYAQHKSDLSHDDFFEQMIRPTLIDHCLECHRTGEESGGLSLETLSQILIGGDRGAAIDKSSPDKSLLIQVLTGRHELKMPPDGALAPDQVDAMREWVQRGAPWPSRVKRIKNSERTSGSSARAAMDEHWAYQPLGHVEVPQLGSRLDAECENELDHFLLEKLSDHQLGFSQPASRQTLIRRATYDLTGLPPTKSEVDAFLSDETEDAWEKVVDRLLQSPRYGERWAKFWLDLARYSDSKGYVYAREERFWVHAWVYRDWVIRAINQDMPYDQFIRLQLAADQLANQPEDLAAMGFLTLGRRFLGVSHDIIADRIDVVSRATMGATIACARCHDHKYDPITIDDYYSLYGIFRNSEEKLISVQKESEQNAEFLDGLQQRQAKLAEVLDRYRRDASQRVRNRIQDYLEAQLHLEDYPEAGFDQIYTEGDILPEFVRRWRDYLEFQSTRNHPLFGAWHLFMEAPEDQFDQAAGEICKQIQQFGDRRFHPEVTKRFSHQPSSKLEVVHRYAELFAEYLASVDQSQDWDGAKQGTDAIGDVLFDPEGPCVIPNESITHTERFFPTNQTEEIWKLQAEIDRWIKNSPHSPAYALTLSDKKQRMLNSHVMRRGDPSLLGERVERGFPRAFRFFDPSDPSIAESYQDGSGRLQFAQAITSPSNPLTGRVAVNRIWAQHFGDGLVKTLSDFGTRADPPTHPELLDWLTLRFIKGGWKQKPIHRMILLSRAYQQSSLVIDADDLKRSQRQDPQNKWLWRFPRRRLDFESLRDSILFVSGQCDLLMGGKASQWFDSDRRTIYCQTDRQFFSNTMRTFDVASPDLSISRRAETTVPQQALFFLNHSFVLDQMRSLVANTASASMDEKIHQIYSRILGRSPSVSEQSSARDFILKAQSIRNDTEEKIPSAWSYGMGRFDSAARRMVGFVALPHYSGHYWQGGAKYPDAQLGWVQLTSQGGHPGNTVDQASIRRWIAPDAMEIRIDSELTHEPSVGDGVHAMIVSDRSGILKEVNVFHQTKPLMIDSLSVEKGEVIDFVVDIGGGLNSDQYLWSPIISSVDTLNANSSLIWDARADFRGTPFVDLDPWVAFAQVLLSSNEFIFVD